MITKPQMLPVYLEEQPSESFHIQLDNLRRLTGEIVDWLDPAHIDHRVPDDTSAVVVPDLTQVKGSR